jgi:thiol-disulfide isomerase/thioredoxin
MKCCWWLLVVLLTPASSSVDIHGVHILSPDNYDDIVLRGGRGGAGTPDNHGGGRHGTLIKFYAPWCQHCQKLLTPWRGLAKACDSYAGTLEANGAAAADSLLVASFDCEATPAHTKMCKAKGIHAFPHIRYVEGSAHAADYMGTRSLQDIVVFIEMQSGIGPFQGLNGMDRLIAYGKRYLLSVLQFVMESNGDTGKKPSTQTMVTLCVIFTVPVLALGACAMTCLYCGLLRGNGGGAKRSAKGGEEEEEADPLGSGGADDENRREHGKDE